jgi:hypothetical protein
MVAMLAEWNAVSSAAQAAEQDADAALVQRWERSVADLTVEAAQLKGISRATAYRYRDEAVAVLAAEAPELPEALDRVQADGWSHVILDGKIVDTDRCRARTTSRK